MAHLLNRPDSDPDVLAQHLLNFAWLARTMGPGFEKGGVVHDFVGFDGSYLGKFLPGRGVFVDADLKDFGINRPIPGVYERSPLRRLFERLLLDETGAITTYDGIINARANGKADDVIINLTSMTTVTNFWYDTFVAGGQPAAGTFLATTAPTDALTDAATTGSWAQLLTAPTGSDKKYLIAMGWGAATAHNYAILVDQLSHCGAFRTTVTTAETIASPTTITRQYGPGTLGAGAQIEFVTQTARTTPTTSTLTVTYRDEGNNSSAPAIAMLANADPVNRCTALPNSGSPFMQLASGDYGARRIDSAQKAATADAAGKLAASIVQPLMVLPGLASNSFVERDAPMNIDGLVELAQVSNVLGCLKLLVFAGGSSTGSILSQLRTAAG